MEGFFRIVVADVALAAAHAYIVGGNGELAGLVDEAPGSRDEL